MRRDGPIIIIEDDQDDQYVLDVIFKRIGCSNRRLCFSDGVQALDYLVNASESPFFVLSDINMPKMNGFELRQQIADNPRLNAMCIPFIFFTTSSNPVAINKAFDMSVQGYFVKPGTTMELEGILRSILTYWNHSKAPGPIPA